jgi:tripartite-type tricarboxylate transporter receptor subunit TctC
MRNLNPLSISSRFIRKIQSFFLLAFLMALSAVATAENYPSKPIHLIVPYPAGSSGDVTARQVGQILSTRMGQQVIIENRPGAGGNIGAASVAKAAPDGYTILYITGHIIAVNPHIVKNPGFDSLNDFVPIMIAARAPALLVVSSDSPIKSVKDLLDTVKQNPGKLSYATSGDGSPQHVMGEKLRQLAGVDIVQIPYKGETPALQDLMGGHIDMCFGFVAGTLPFVRDGKLRVLAITSEKRLAAFPDYPTLAESGVPGFAEATLTGYVAPRGTPPAIVNKLNDEIRAALKILADEIAKRGSEIIAGTPQEAAAMLKAEHERYGKLVKALGLKQQ